MTSSPLHSETFRPLVGLEFAIREFELALRLEQTRDLEVEGTGRPDSLPCPFSLLFRGPADRLLAQGTFLLHHEATGEIPIFLVPVGQEGESILYEAVFG